MPTEIELPDGVTIDYSQPLPPRGAFSYHGQHKGISDVQRLIEMANESTLLALSSKVPETATTRRDFAMECYYQSIEVLGPRAADPYLGTAGDKSVLERINQVARSLLRLFPSFSKANEALGVFEKAQKVKTPSLREKRLRIAEHLAQEALAMDPICGLHGGAILKRIQDALAGQTQGDG